MKFKREDIGLYVTCTLAGAGVGLLAGTLVASRVSGPMPLVVPDWSDDDSYEEPKKKPKKNTRKKKSRKKVSETLDPEMLEFIDEFNPSTIQVEMLKNGLIDIEELKQTLLEENLAKEREPYDYAIQYRDDDKPDLAELTTLPEEEDPVDGRWQIHREIDPTVNLRKPMFYDVMDNAFYVLTRNNKPVPTSLHGTISDEAWEVLRPYLLEGWPTLYVEDLEKDIFYQFEAVGLEELAEEDSD